MASKPKRRKQTHVIIVNNEQVLIERGEPKELKQTPALNRNPVFGEFAEQLNLYRSEFYTETEKREAEDLQRLIFAPQKKPKTVLREVYHYSDLVRKFTEEYWTERIYIENVPKDYETLENVFFNLEGRWIEILPRIYQIEGDSTDVTQNDVMLTNFDAELTVPQQPKEIDAMMGIGLSNDEVGQLCETN